MRPRLAVFAGLLAGLLAAAAILGAIVAFVPVPGPSAAPLPTLDLATPVPAVSAGPSVSPPASGSGSPGASAVVSPGAFHVGEPAPPLVVSQLGGGTIDLAALKGHPIWLNFMATWCPPCRDELPLMGGFAARYGPKGLVVIAIDVREDEAVVSPFLNSVGVTFPVGLDRDGTAQAAWGAFALPVHFWIDAQGIVRDGVLGGIGPDIMARGLRAILPGVNVTP